MRDVIVKIAIVDDTLSNLLIVRKHVELLGHTAVTARDGGEAVRRGRLAHRAQDLVLVAADERGDGRAAAGEVDAVRAGGARADLDSLVPPDVDVMLRRKGLDRRGHKAER